MAITQAQVDKDWQDTPSAVTPIMSTDMEALSRAVRDFRYMVPTGVTSVDEFDDDSLAAAWTRVDGTGVPAGNAVWTERGDVLSLAQLGGDSANTVRGIVRPLSGAGGSVAVGDAFITAIHLHGPAAPFVMGGIVLSDSATFGSGTQVVALAYFTSTVGQVTLAAWGGTGWGLGGSGSDNPFQGNQCFLRLVCTAANTWRVDTSPDGVSWALATSTFAKTVTPTHVGFVSSSWGSAVRAVVSYHFLRRVSGVS